MSDESSSQQFLGTVGEDLRAASFGDLYALWALFVGWTWWGAVTNGTTLLEAPLGSWPRFDPFGHLARAIYWLRSTAFERSLGVI